MFDISRVHDVIVDDVRIPALLANRMNGSIQCNVFFYVNTVFDLMSLQFGQ